MNNIEYTSDNESIISETNSDIINQIYNDESDFLYSEKINNHYYIGSVSYIKKTKQLIFSCSISSKSFFKYSGIQIIDYLYSFAISYCFSDNIQIMKLFILKDNTYTVIIKTYWIHLIQRHFKKLFKEKMNIMNERKKLRNIKYSQIYGKYPPGLNILPSIYGMLVKYAK